MNNNDLRTTLLLALLTTVFGVIGFVMGRATSTPKDLAVWYNAPGSEETMGAEGHIVRFTVGGHLYVVNASTDRDPSLPLMQSKPHSKRD
jgi:hypothetical protein